MNTSESPAFKTSCSVPEQDGPQVSCDLCQQARLIAALRTPERFGSACAAVTLVETHISYVLLSGRHAYKIKKAVNLGFLDFTTLSMRRFYCEEELRLNRRTAPALYLDVVPITGSADNPRIGGPGPVVEWAVRMQEFSQEALLSRMIARGDLTPRHIDVLAAKIADFHSRIERAAPGAPVASPDNVLELALANLTQVKSLLEHARERATVAALAEWTRGEHAAHHAAWEARRQGGFIRECHGDLHLGNIALVDGDMTPFDCIEFNDRMRWIDVMSEIAFTVMDLEYRGRSDLAHRCINAYLEITGDYEGLGVLSFYLVYRAMVRAKIACLRRAQTPPGVAAEGLDAECSRHIELATSYAGRVHPGVVITHGLSGSGKTTLSQALLERTGAVRLRSDVERKRLQGLSVDAHTRSAIASALYAPAATKATYDRLLALTRVVTAAGFIALVDAGFLQRWQRDLFRTLSLTLGVPFVIVTFVANEPTLRERILQRSLLRTDASEADAAVLQHQLKTQQPFSPVEQPFVVTYDAERPLDRARLADSWHAVMQRLGISKTETDARAPDQHGMTLD